MPSQFREDHTLFQETRTLPIPFRKESNAKSTWLVPDPVSTAVRTDESQEKILWVGTSSQLENLQIYVWCLFFFWLIFPMFYAIIAWFYTKRKVYELTTERMRITKGLLTRVTEDLELYRVKNTACVEPFLMRMFGLGIVELYTSDPTHPITRVNAIPNASGLREQVRKIVEANRERKGVREVDYYTRGSMNSLMR